MPGAAWMHGYAAELAAERSLRTSALAGACRVDPGAEALAGMQSLCVANLGTLLTSISCALLAFELCDAIIPSTAAGFTALPKESVLLVEDAAFSAAADRR